MSMNDTLRRDFFRALAGGAAGLTLTWRGLAQAPPTPIKATKLTDRIAVVSGDGGNIGVVISDDGLMMIDGGYANRTDDLFKTIKENVDAHSVKLLFNTHWHGDHVGCNEVLGKSGVKIIAHENVKKRLSTKITMEAFGRTVEPLKPEGYPTQEFAKNGKLTFGKEKVEYVHFPTGHTDGDAYLFFPGTNVLHTGDLLFQGMFPVIDYSTGGWVGGMAGAAETMYKVTDAQTKVISGHGPMATREDLKASHEMLATVHERFEKLMKQGKSVDDVVAAAPLTNPDEKWGKGIFKTDAWTKIAYSSVLRRYQKA